MCVRSFYGRFPGFRGLVVDPSMGFKHLEIAEAVFLQARCPTHSVKALRAGI